MDERTGSENEMLKPETPIEELAVVLTRISQSNKPIEIYRKVEAFGRIWWFRWRSRKQWMGRFGGGWNWSVGIQIGGSSVVVNLLIFAVGVHPKPKERQ